MAPQVFSYVDRIDGNEPRTAFGNDKRTSIFVTKKSDAFIRNVTLVANVFDSPFCPRI